MKKILLYSLAFAFCNAASAQLQNANFEQWENPVADGGIGNRPTGWIRTNEVPISETFGFYHNGATDAQSGDYALRLSIWYTYDKDMAYQIAPITTRPAALTGYYKYTDNFINNNLTGTVTPDEANVAVYLTKWNSVLQQNDTIGTGQLSFGASSSYSYFNCPITYSSTEIPDTIKVIFDCSLMKKGDNSNGHTTINLGGVGSILTIDNIALEESLNTDTHFSQNLVVYPNPVQDILRVKDFEGDAYIYNTAGQLIASVQNVNANGIDTGKLQPGAYILVLQNVENAVYTKFIKE